MSQLTIYLDDDTTKLLKRQLKASGESTSKWIASAIRKRAEKEWPAEILAILGTWNEKDFPDVKALRKGYGADVKRESF